MLETAKSPTGVEIRLTGERWAHITEEHSELAGQRYEVLETIANPFEIYLAESGESYAIREVENGKFLVVVHREVGADGFVITAFLPRSALRKQRKDKQRKSYTLL